MRDLEDTINAVDCDTVIIATPMDLRKIITINKPATVVTYRVTDREPPLLRDILSKHIQAWGKREGTYAASHHVDKAGGV